MTEVTSLLKSLSMTEENEPRVKNCQIKRLRADEKSSVLLDGGATHCVRERRSIEEWERASSVRVQLASGEIATLLSDQPVQSIIPVCKVTELGYTVRWDRNGCQIEHVVMGKLPVKMVQGCPTIEVERDGKLLEEIEDMEKRKARVRAILHCNVLAKNEHEEEEVAALTSMFPTTPLRIGKRIGTLSNYQSTEREEGESVRRKGWKRLEIADTVVVSLTFSTGSM